MLIEMGHVLSRHLNISNFLVQISETLKKKGLSLENII